MLGVSPARGRDFTPTEQLDARLHVILSGLWRDRFASDPGLVGRTLEAACERTIIGVMPVRLPREPHLENRAPILGGLVSIRQVVGRLAPAARQPASSR